MMPDRKFTHISSSLNRLLAHYHLTDSVEEERIFQNWKSIVGKSIAMRCQPEKIEGDTLFLRVENNIWKEELQRKASNLMKRINSRLVKRIIFL
jgi:predicted nucleic acid-binding Zn ribbon protein